MKKDNMEIPNTKGKAFIDPLVLGVTEEVGALNTFISLDF